MEAGVVVMGETGFVRTGGASLTEAGAEGSSAVGEQPTFSERVEVWMSPSAEAGLPEASSAGVEERSVTSEVAEAQVASSTKAGVWHATPEQTEVEGVASAAKSCSIWIAKLNQASGSASE